MEGFDAGDRDLPTPPVPVAEETKAAMALTLSAIVHGATPEEIVGYLDDGFPDDVREALDRPGERDEMGAHIDLLLTVMQTPALATVA